MDDIYEQAALREYELASRELTKPKETLKALGKSQQRCDQLIARATDESPVKPACKAGCAYCCHYKVEAKAHEILLIQEYLQQQVPADERALILADAENNAALIRLLTPEQHLTTNIKCPLLVNNQCRVYPVRPYRCRHFHALDVSGCEASFQDPTRMDITSGLIESVAIFGDAHSQGFEAAAANRGYDTRTYDLTTGLLAAFTEKNTDKRFMQGKKTFASAIEVDDSE